MRLTKKDHLDKYFIIKWVDIQSEHRVPLQDMIDRGLHPCEASGKIVYLDRKLVVVEHDTAGEEGDYTNLHPAVITELIPLNQRRKK